MLKVYHAVDPKFGMGEVKQEFPADYELVATVETASVEEAFRLTNHIDGDWRYNEGVKPTELARRSTSVGDIVVDMNGRIWECASCGWTERGAA